MHALHIHTPPPIHSSTSNSMEFTQVFLKGDAPPNVTLDKFCTLLPFLLWEACRPHGCLPFPLARFFACPHTFHNSEFLICGSDLPRLFPTLACNKGLVKQGLLLNFGKSMPLLLTALKMPETWGKHKIATAKDSTFDIFMLDLHFSLSFSTCWGSGCGFQLTTCFSTWLMDSQLFVVHFVPRPRRWLGTTTLSSTQAGICCWGT